MRQPINVRDIQLDPLLAVALLACVGGALVMLLFHSELGAQRQFGAASLYLLAMPASLLLARWLQLRAPRRAPRRAAVRALPRRQARRQRALPPRRRLRAALAAALVGPFPR